MTLHREAHNNSHYSRTPALVRVAADHTRRLSAHHVSKAAHSAIGFLSYSGPQGGGAARCRASHSQNETAARRFAAALRVRSRVALRGGVSSWELFRISGACRRVRTSEHLFLESRVQHEFPSSAGMSCSAPTGSSRRTGSRDGQGAPSGTRTSSSQATGSRMRARRSRFIPTSSNNRLPSPAADRAAARSVKVEGQLVLRCPQRKGSAVRSSCCGHAFAPALSPTGILADQNVLRPPTMFAHGWASSVRRVTARRSTRSVRAGAAFGAASRAVTQWGAGDGKSHDRRFGGRATAPWVEGEPRECDGSAWDRLPPLVQADRSAA